MVNYVHYFKGMKNEGTTENNNTEKGEGKMEIKLTEEKKTWEKTVIRWAIESDMEKVRGLIADETWTEQKREEFNQRLEVLKRAWAACL